MTHLKVGQPVGEAEDVVHDEDDGGLFYSFKHVSPLGLEWLGVAKEDDRKDTCHDEGKELHNDEIWVEDHTPGY